MNKHQVDRIFFIATAFNKYTTHYLDLHPDFRDNKGVVGGGSFEEMTAYAMGCVEAELDELFKAHPLTESEVEMIVHNIDKIDKAMSKNVRRS